MTPDPTRGEVIATVNGVPLLYDWQERLDRDRNPPLRPPVRPFVNNFQGVTGTRMLDILSYDAMDKLINSRLSCSRPRRKVLSYARPGEEPD